MKKVTQWLEAGLAQTATGLLLVAYASCLGQLAGLAV